MAQLSAENREIAIKIVYYGPALSGKTTNLQQLFHRIEPKSRGRLMTLDTKDDRTLFFDMMPVFFRTGSGAKVKLKLFTVPGQVMHESTRRIVLQGSDGIVFVADSRRSETAVTRSYWTNMLANLEANALDPRTLPIVVQLNKLDLPEAHGQDEIAALCDGFSSLVVPAVAVRGEGVVETLHSLLALTYRRLDAQHGLARTWHITEAEFLAKIFDHVDLKGTGLARVGAAP